MKKLEPVSIDTARELIDFRGGTGNGQGIPQPMAQAQLDGSVALHNILAREGFAYLADEVGMGKTYVALGTVALMRFFNPGLRVAYLAPRENIQEKWTKELRNFSRISWRWRDHRVRTAQDLPACDYVRCGNLSEWARQSVRRPNRDVFLRLTSFSFPLAGQGDKWAAKRDEIVELAPMIDRAEFDLRSKENFKEAYARAINTLLPHYDLLVVDEAHNLKGGRASHTARNRLIEMVLGSASGQTAKHYGKRFDRVLFLSATPLESDFAQLWNQLDLFGLGGGRYDKLRDEAATDVEKRALTGEFLVRRLTGLSIAGSLHTKNMYRREWRGGGCTEHDDALIVPDARQRLIVALIQKKVAEVIHDARFGASFQMGMLASFESFAQTASNKLPKGSEEVPSNFDQTSQTDAQVERDGIDTLAVNQIAESYRRTFKTAMPHPKMDAVVDSLTASFDSGEKALVFVRRVRSVTEIREKLCDRYDIWFRRLLEARLEPRLRGDLESAWALYDEERQSRRARTFAVERDNAVTHHDDEEDEPLPFLADTADDEGGHDTFFSWFFRGAGPAKFLSGAAFRRNRFASEGSVYTTFFEDNHVAQLLGGPGPDILTRLSDALGRPIGAVEASLRDLAFGACVHRTKRDRLPRFVVYEGYQAAALGLLARSKMPLADEAAVILRERYQGVAKASASRAPAAFPGPEQYLATRTFFTELRARPQLREELWPEPTGAEPEGRAFANRFRAREQRRELLSAVARLGHTFVELWVLAVNQLGTLEIGGRESPDEGVEALMTGFLELLETQRRSSEAGQSAFNGFYELSRVGKCHELILSVNFPDAVERPLDELPKLLSTTLGRQTPVAGMHGGVSKTAVSQFRMPGYPLALITTDVLQEGEDLHTFCSKVIHYGISWTPSAMEQRTGRVDRIGSKAHRTLDNLPQHPAAEALLQVHYPYLADTVEVLQVEKVFERMNRFLRTIHHTGAEQDVDSKIDAKKEFVRTRKDIHQITTPLRSAFEVPVTDLEGAPWDVAAPDRAAKAILSHFDFVVEQLGELVAVDWEPGHEGRAKRYGTVYVDSTTLVTADDPRPRDAPGIRHQPFALYLRAAGSGHALLHGTSPIGDVDRGTPSALELLELQRRLRGAKLCRLPSKHVGTYTLTAEGDLLLSPHGTQVEEVLDLVQRIAISADRVEREVFASGADHRYTDFEESLVKEANRAAD